MLIVTIQASWLAYKNINSTLVLMRHAIVQEHAFGCGVACVAFVAQVPYHNVAELLGNNKAISNGFRCIELITALHSYGYKEYTLKYLKPRLRRSIYKNGVIVFVKRSKRYPRGHYLVRYSGQWMDPWVNFNPRKNVKGARADFRKRLPGQPIYALLPVHDK